MIFKYSELEKFFKFLKENSKVTTLKDWDGSNEIILRHDVDFDIQAAYDLALFEEKCGIRSSFFIMTTNLTYNPSTLENRKLLKRISDLGFEIGLHFDPLVYKHVDTNKLDEKVDEESFLLSKIIEKEIESVSLHNPSVHGQYTLFSNYNNAYDAKIFSSETYLSDSRMKFSIDPYEFVKRVKNHPIQILLHPLYYTIEGKTMPEIFYSFVKNFLSKIDGIYTENSTYAELMKTDLFSYVTKIHGEKIS